jgi:hypothetical protein
MDCHHVVYLLSMLSGKSVDSIRLFVFFKESS